MNQSINDEAVYRTALATPGLLITIKQKVCLIFLIEFFLKLTSFRDG